MVFKAPMNFLLLFFFILSTCFAGKLVLIGGGARPREAMQRFVQLSGSQQSRILVVPWASGSLEGAANIRAELAAFTRAPIAVAPLTPQSPAQVLGLINSATGIFFAGGDQSKLMKTIESLRLADLLRQKFNQGIAFGGTSAGTAFMSQRMITGTGDLRVINGAKVELGRGLGLLPPHIIVDQHFIVRGRFNRLAGIVLHTNLVGVGIDEGTALVVLDNRAQVIGPTQVLLFKASSTKKLIVRVLVNQEIFDLSIR